MHIIAALQSKLSLTDTLAAIGCSHRKTNSNKNSKHHVIDNDADEVVFTGTAHEVWEWLRDQAQQEVYAAECAAGWDASP